jgi:AcrR family transcriptional regulator
MTTVDRRASRHQATRHEIISAAWELAREHGLGGWSLRDLATAVGMRAPSLYVYFDSKNAVYDALFADGYSALLERVDAVPDAEADLRRAAHLFFDFCVEEPARHALLFLRTLPGFEPSPDSYRLAQEVLARLTRLLAASGATRRAQVDLWTALLSGLATQQISNDPGGRRWARLVDRAVDMYEATQLG